MLVNNAGFGIYGGHAAIPWEQEQRMLKRDTGYILQISSTGAYQPSPTYAAYGAAKSFVLNFGEALNYELRNTRVSCTVLSLGVTATEFLRVSGQTPTPYQRLFMMQSAEVVRIGLKAMLRRKPSVVAGRLNALRAWSTRLLPRHGSAAVAHRLMTLS
ncbi:MAG: SDR family NAD(P)-dependent oxidoreductase [Gammaproteobacteria bacterium]